MDNRKDIQNFIIQETNPVDERFSYHLWVRCPEDIKSFEEAIDQNDDNYSGTPDWTSDDEKKHWAKGK